MPALANSFPNGLTARQIADIITEGKGHAWSPSKTPDIVKDLARTQKGEVLPLLNHRDVTIGAAGTRVYREDQIIVALIHLLLRELGPTPRPVAHMVSDTLMNWKGRAANYAPAFLKMKKEDADRLSPAQWIIDRWRSGDRGFSFLIEYGWDRKSGAPEHVCGIAHANIQPFEPFASRKDRIALATTRLDLDEHLARIFGD